MGRGEDNAIYSIVRVLNGFASDEGYAALRQRFEAAPQSWASVYEAQGLHRLLVKLLAHHDIGRQDGAGEKLLSGAEGETADDRVMNAFHRMTGEVPQLYELANLDGLSVKRQRTLPVRCRVYDLLNFASELATHHATSDGPRMAQGWIGTLISHEYDLENPCDSFDEFQDLFLERKPGGEAAVDSQ